MSATGDSGGSGGEDDGGPFGDLLEPYGDYIWEEGEGTDGPFVIAGSIKIFRVALAFVGGIILSIFTVPINVFLTLQNEVIGALDGLLDWITSALNWAVSYPVHVLGETISPVESELQSLGLLALPASIVLGLILAWLFWRVLS